MNRSQTQHRYQPRRAARDPHKEPLLEQMASFVSFFIYLLVLKSFFLPLFVIPTGSMAETLYGAYAPHACPNCGITYPVGFLGSPTPLPPPVIRCPNCRWHEGLGAPTDLARLQEHGIPVDAVLHEPLSARAGDRIMVHGWPYELGGAFGPQRWDVIVFKVPSDGQTNYIKRLIGLPGETIELIDGNVFVTDPQRGETTIAQKPPKAQDSLWFPVFDQNHPPRKPSAGGRYFPRWAPLAGDWQGLDTRLPAFAFTANEAGRIRFVSDPRPDAVEPAPIVDMYGYNAPHPGMEYHIVDEIRASTEVRLEEIADGGFIELSTTQHGREFFARYIFAGDSLQVSLEHQGVGESSRTVWQKTTIPRPAGPLRLALSNADFVARVELNGETLLASTPEQYSIEPAEARALSQRDGPPRIEVGVGGLTGQLAHLLIERDVYYTSDVRVGVNEGPGIGTQGHPIHLGPDDFYALGDNSPASLDCRFAFTQVVQDVRGRRWEMDPVGGHLAGSGYQLGTVPRDQLIGPAFLVYWPAGTDKVWPSAFRQRGMINHLPGPGLIRWIH